MKNQKLGQRKKLDPKNKEHMKLSKLGYELIWQSGKFRWLKTDSPLYKTIDGKKFRKNRIIALKSEVEKDIKWMKERNQEYRVIKYKHGHVIYSRTKDFWGDEVKSKIRKSDIIRILYSEFQRLYSEDGQRENNSIALELSQKIDKHNNRSQTKELIKGFFTKVHGKNGRIERYNNKGDFVYSESINEVSNRLTKKIWK